MESVADITPLLADITPLVRRPRNNRSAVSNGNRLFAPETMDGRSVVARRFHDLLEQIMADLGGADRLSEGQRQLARRAATMAMQCELMEAEAVAGRSFDIECFGQLTDRLGRCFQRLGLHRVKRDVTPTLADIVARPPCRGSFGRCVVLADRHHGRAAAKAVG